ncbi:MAG: septum formation initiator family protein [Alphaproteobacteria bacterium]|nr:septum formation initiator family protein [Alphaproteobacteria bacterium]
MNLSRAIRRLTRALIGPAIGISLTSYFAYNVVIGDRGLLAWRRLTQQLLNEQEHLAALQVERKALAGKVADLTPEHLDPDLLDERVRATLNLVAPNELIIMREVPGH